MVCSSSHRTGTGPQPQPFQSRVNTFRARGGHLGLPLLHVIAAVDDTEALCVHTLLLHYPGSHRGGNASVTGGGVHNKNRSLLQQDPKHQSAAEKRALSRDMHVTSKPAAGSTFLTAATSVWT